MTAIWTAGQPVVELAGRSRFPDEAVLGQTIGECGAFDTARVARNKSSVTSLYLVDFRVSGENAGIERPTIYMGPGCCAGDMRFPTLPLTGKVIGMTQCTAEPRFPHIHGFYPARFLSAKNRVPCVPCVRRIECQDEP